MAKKRGPTPPNPQQRTTPPAIHDNPTPDSQNNQDLAVHIASERTLISLQEAGALPSPEILAKMNILIPGSAERILERWEKQSDHRMGLEKTVIFGGSKRSTLGLVAGTVFGLACVYAAFLLGMAGKEIAAGAVVGIPCTSIGLALVNVYKQQREERVEKEKVRMDHLSPKKR